MEPNVEACGRWVVCFASKNEMEKFVTNFEQKMHKTYDVLQKKTFHFEFCRFSKQNFLLFSNFSDFFFFRCIIESLRLTTRKLRFDAKIAPSSGSKIIRKFSCFKFLFFGVWHHYMIYTVFIHFTQWNANKFRWTLPFWNFSE